MKTPKDYTLYFELYGKKMKTTILAESEEQAKREVMKKLIFHKVEVAKNEWNDIADIMDGISKTFKG